MKKIYIPQPIAAEGEHFLQEKGYQIFRGTGKLDSESIKKDIAECDAMILRTVKVDREILQAAKKLKIVARHGAGVDNLDYRAANEMGITATYSPFSTGNSVAEFTMAALLNLAKKIQPCSREMKKGNFNYKLECKGNELSGKTIGILGFGEIGRRVAQKAFMGFDMNILAYVPRPEGKEIPDYVSLAGWNDLFRESDYVTVHVPGGSQNRHLIGWHELSEMKKNACLINVSRGGVMDEEAFIRAVREGTIAGGAMDVFEQEPLPAEHPLQELDNVLLTPHMASNTRECMIRIAMDTAVDVDLVLQGKLPRYPIRDK